MSIIDTSAVDLGSNDSIIMDIVSPLNEMAMGWYSLKTGKGLVQAPGVLAGVQPGATLQTATPIVLSQQPIENQLLTPFVQNSGLILLVIAVVVVAALMVR